MIPYVVSLLWNAIALYPRFFRTKHGKARLLPLFSTTLPSDSLLVQALCSAPLWIALVQGHLTGFAIRAIFGRALFLVMVIIEVISCIAAFLILIPVSIQAGAPLCLPFRCAGFFGVFAIFQGAMAKPFFTLGYGMLVFRRLRVLPLLVLSLIVAVFRLFASYLC